MDTLATWFGLKEGREDFYIQSDRDYSLFFARADLNETIHHLLEECYRGHNPPKFVVYGDWGTGKTHTLRHVKWVLETNSTWPAKVVFIDFPDITAQSTYSVAHALLLDALGLETVKQWVNAYNLQHSGDTLNDIKAFTQSEDVAKAMYSLIGFGDTARTCWDWLRGLPLAASDARGVGLPPCLTESTHLVSILRFIGRMALEIDKAILVFIMDEGDKLRNVSKADCISHWLNAFRKLSDVENQECGLIIAGAFNDTDLMPDMLNDQQVMTRFGPQNYIMLNRFQKEEARVFTSDLLRQWVDEVKREAIQREFSGDSEGEAVDEGSFPFTVQGLEAFAEYAVRNGASTSPRDIQISLTKVLNKAIDESRHVLSSGFVYSAVQQ
jgi:Cdc6-like AAA superfamily ATPase